MSCFIKDCFLKLAIKAKVHYFALKVKDHDEKRKVMKIQDDIRP